MKSLMTSAAMTLALTAGAQAQTTVDLDDLVGQPVYALGDGAALAEGAVTDLPEGAATFGVIEGRTEDGVRVLLSETMAAEFGAEVDVRVDQLRIVPDADDPGELFVVLDPRDGNLNEFATDEKREELLQESLSNEEVLEQSPGMTTSPVAEGTDGMTDDGEPIDDGAALDVGESGSEVDVVVVEPEPETEEVVQAEPEAVVVTEPEAPLREVDISDPDAAPIENAENVVPEDTLLKAETGLASPSHTAPMPGEEAELAGIPGEQSVTGIALPNAPEGFSVADMRTFDVAQLIGVRVYTLGDDLVGEVSGWIGEERGRLPDGAVIEIGGLLGIGERKVGVPTDQLTLLTDVDGNDLRVYLDMDEERLGSLPEIE